MKHKKKNDVEVENVKLIKVIDVLDEIKSLVNDKIELKNDLRRQLKYVTIVEKSNTIQDFNLITISNTQIFFNAKGELITVDVLEKQNNNMLKNRNTIYLNKDLTDKVKNR